MKIVSPKTEHLPFCKVLSDFHDSVIVHLLTKILSPICCIQNSLNNSKCWRNQQHSVFLLSILKQRQKEFKIRELFIVGVISVNQTDWTSMTSANPFEQRFQDETSACTLEQLISFLS